LPVVNFASPGALAHFTTRHFAALGSVATFYNTPLFFSIGAWTFAFVPFIVPPTHPHPRPAAPRRPTQISLLFALSPCARPQYFIKSYRYCTITTIADARQWPGLLALLDNSELLVVNICMPKGNCKLFSFVNNVKHSIGT
jgi:hypothetical protein